MGWGDVTYASGILMGAFTGDSIEGAIFGDALVAKLGEVGIPAVPVPAAAWLFGSGLLGLVGVTRRTA